MTVLRKATANDAEGMAEVQNAIYRAGLRSDPADVDDTREFYVDSPHELACTVAVHGDGRILGFQSLKRAWPGNFFDVEPGWGVIGTHIHPDVHRTGLGRRLFAETLRAARAAGLEHIDATIGEDNEPGLAYYQAQGFVPYRELPGAIGHRLDL